MTFEADYGMFWAWVVVIIFLWLMLLLGEVMRMSDDLVNWHKEQASSAMNSLSCGSEKWEYREAYKQADFHHEAAARITALEAERTKVREVLASIDILSLPNDYPTEKMAEVRMETLNQRTLEGLALVGKVEILEAENKRLREALTPFAKEAARYDPPDGDGIYTAWDSAFKIDDLRRAAAALEKK